MEKILLYYKYIAIEDPASLADWQRTLCTRLGLKGRIIVAHEGINGTLSGLVDAVEEYKQVMESHPLFGSIDFKESVPEGSGAIFPRLRVVVKEEIVRLGIDPALVKASDHAPTLTAAQAHAKMATDSPKTIVFDIRNDYETAIGAFTGSIVADIKTFRELPAYIDNNMDLFKDKEVIMVCTGNVRCERASAYLLSKKCAKAVYSIFGGIHRYIEAFPDGFFRGKNFVFDARMSVAANSDILGRCALCAVAHDTYSHCSRTACHRLLLLCDTCKNKTDGRCSLACKDTP